MWVRGNSKPYPYFEEASLNHQHLERHQVADGADDKLPTDEHERRDFNAFRSQFTTEVTLSETSRGKEESYIESLGIMFGKKEEGDKPSPVYFWDRQVENIVKKGDKRAALRSANAVPLQGAMAPVRNLASCWTDRTIDRKAEKARPPPATHEVTSAAATIALPNCTPVHAPRGRARAYAHDGL